MPLDLADSVNEKQSRSLNSEMEALIMPVLSRLSTQRHGNFIMPVLSLLNKFLAPIENFK